VENAEDDLVQKTEVAITLMKTVLDNVGFSFQFGCFLAHVVLLTISGSPNP
jgi:hypothetical protein